MARAHALKFAVENRIGEISFDHLIDARGLRCPLPMLSTSKSLERLRHREILKVLATDAESVNYFESFVQQSALELVFWEKQDGVFSFYIRKP